jgi:hypothetical protein
VYCKNAKYNLPWRIYKTTDKYFNYGKKGYRFCEIGLMLYSLSEHQIEALSNLLRGNDNIGAFCLRMRENHSVRLQMADLLGGCEFCHVFYEKYGLNFCSISQNSC